MKVTITIETGNEAMRTERDIANGLRRLAERINTDGLNNISKVMDRNGNSVGTVEVSD